MDILEKQTQRHAANLAILGVCLVLAPGCEDDDDPAQPAPLSPFTLRFTAVYDDAEVGCGDRLADLGSSGTGEIELSDLRFYVSDLQFYDASGAAVPIELDSNDFQLNANESQVALIDLTGTNQGACAGKGLSFPEGTARTNNVITGMTRPDEVDRVTFVIGMSQNVMKQTLANHTAEDAPSPLREMHWSWAYAYRHFVMNFTILDGGVAGEGYLHIGSTDCGGDGTRALTDREECGNVNSPAVSLRGFNLSTDEVAVDIGAALANLDLRVAASDTSQVLVPGVSCHSSTGQPDCVNIFLNFGVNVFTGESAADLNTVFFAR